MSIDFGSDSIDDVLAEVGDFGSYQVFTFALLSCLHILTGTSTVNYMISANILDYRCKVPVCDVGENNREIAYDRPWLHDAIPIKIDKIDKCSYYALRNNTETIPGQCSADMFDKSKQVSCSEYVYGSDEKNIQTEFNIHCEDEYKLAFVGTLGNLARFIFLPMAGLLSDRFGRLPGILIGTQLSSVISLIKSFSINYPMYAVLEFLEATCFTCTFTGIHVLAVEYVSSNHRVLGNNILSIAFPTGEIIFGVVAMYVHDFRLLTRIFAIPGLFVFVCFWLLPESVRWLLVTGRIDRAVEILKKIAEFNKKALSEKSIEVLKLRYSTQSIANKYLNDSDKKAENQSVWQIFSTILKSKILCLRFFICCYLWIACCFSYYGVSISSTQIPGTNHYISFIIVMAIEIPSNLLLQLLFNRLRRRLLLFIAIFVAAISIVVTPFIPKENSFVVLLLIVLGKGSITFAFTGLYVYTAEQWPTNIRSTVMNTCSMIGRVGSMVSPFAVILGGKMGVSPAFLFAGSAFIAAICFLFGPETYGKRMPDTIEEAEDL